MKLPPETVIRFAFAITAGVVWAASFPTLGIAGFAWVAPGLLLAVTAGAPAGLVFRVGYVAGAVHYLISLSWLRFIPFPAGAFAGWFALSLFLALFPPLWLLACWRIGRFLVPAVESTPRGTGPWRALADRLAGAAWWRLNAWFALCAASWVAWEMVLARLFGGFPWNLLGVSQHRMLPLIQVSAYTGVYGVSFAVVWFSASLLAAVLLLARDPDRPALWRRPLVFPALMVVAMAGGGFLAITAQPQPTRQITVALVQPSIPQTVIFDPDGAPQRFETLMRLTEQALATRPDLVVWPEASLPGGMTPENFDRVASKVREAGVWMVLGSDDVEEVAPGQYRAYNASFLLTPEGEVAAAYRKRRLVMFGEYIPFVEWLPFLQRLAPIGDGFHPGPAPVPFRIEPLGVTTSVLICFEDNFPQQAREHAVPGTDFLLNLTNDAWFGRSAAQWQHAANSAFRAIENGIPLVRCANNGISCWIDPLGRFHSTRLAEGRDVYEAGFDVTTVTFGAGGRTFYNRFGDVFGWACILATVAALRPWGR